MPINSCLLQFFTHWLFFYKSAIELNAILPGARLEIKNNSNYFIYLLLDREILKFVRLIEVTQTKMAAFLYKDNSSKILSNPLLYKKLEEEWGDWDND